MIYIFISLSLAAHACSTLLTYQLHHCDIHIIINNICTHSHFDTIKPFAALKYPAPFTWHNYILHSCIQLINGVVSSQGEGPGTSICSLSASLKPRLFHIHITGKNIWSVLFTCRCKCIASWLTCLCGFIIKRQSHSKLHHNVSTALILWCNKTPISLVTQGQASISSHCQSLESVQYPSTVPLACAGVM